MGGYKKLTAKERFAQLQDNLRIALSNGDDTSDIRFDIEQARVDIVTEEAEQRLSALSHTGAKN